MNEAAQDIEPLWNIAKVSRVTGIPEPTLAVYRSKGMGPAFCKFGKRIMYQPADVRAYIQRSRRTQVALTKDQTHAV